MLIVVVHHIVSDGWSLGILLRELGTLYGALVAGRPSPLPELAIQYADYALWQREWLSGAALAGRSRTGRSGWRARRRRSSCRRTGRALRCAAPWRGAAVCVAGI